jgi:copper chaperone
MQTLTIKVQNVKCNGCVANISTKLGEMNGIADVQVTIPDGMVSISGDNLDSVTIKEKLIALGYPPVDG